MTTKTQFFAMLNDKENRLNDTAHIAVYADANGNTSVIVSQQSAPNIWLSNHKSTSTTAAAVAKYTAWLNEWFTAQAEAEQARIDLLAQIEADHAEGEAVVAAINNDIAAGIAHAEALQMDRQMHQDEFFNAAPMMRGVWVNLNHAEALADNAEYDKAIGVIADNLSLFVWDGATETIKQQIKNYLGDKAPAYTNTENVIPMNKAKAKQNQTPDNLPRLQLVDVMRAFLRSVPTSSQEQIEAVGDLSHKELRNLIIKMTAKGARVTAHLTKSKSAGYGFLTFGYNGQLPPGTYHKIVVSNMKNAREVASQYGAVMWNF